MLGASHVIRLGALPLIVACSINNEGLDPPLDELYFPIANAMSRDGEFLFVANSNFDLRYNGGTIQAFELDAVQAELDACDDSECEIAPSDVLAAGGAAIIGSHVSDLVPSESGDRVYLSVRGNRNITWIDWDAESGLDCGQKQGEDRCRANHRGDDEAVSREELPPDPMGLATGALESTFGLPEDSGDFVVMAHRLGQASLFLDHEDDGARSLRFVDGEKDFPEDVVSARFDSRRNQLWMPSSTGNVIGIVGLAIGPSTDPLNSGLFDAGTIRVIGSSSISAGDLRDVVFDPRPEFDRAYLLSRIPEAVFVTQYDATDPGRLRVARVIDLGSGPSKLELGTFMYDGEERPLLFASCFDSGEIYVVDPDLGEVLTILRRVSGPFDLSTDTERSRIYVTDFRSSVIRVVDLEPLLACLNGDENDGSCEPTLLGSIGSPQPVSELQ